MNTKKTFLQGVLSTMFLYGTLLTPVQAADFNPVTVKTIHIHLHGNSVGWSSNLHWLNMLKGNCPIPYPHPPVAITVFADPGNVGGFTDWETDIYWSGTHLARYTTSTVYTLEKFPSCEWTTGPTIKSGEIIDYRTRSNVSIDYLHKSLNAGTGLYYEPEPALRLKEDALYSARIRGSGSAAGQKCDVVIGEPYVNKEFPVVASNALEMSDTECVLSSLHRFPGTNNWIDLKTYDVSPDNSVPAKSVGMRTHSETEATVFEVNVPIPADKFIAPNFPFLTFPSQRRMGQ